MAWLRVGDNINTHPLMSRLVEACEYDHALKNEALGLFIAMATSSAAHLTDYVVEPGLVGVLAPGREKLLLDLLRGATLVESFKDEEEGRWLYRLTNDSEFVHMRSRAEVEIDRDRSRDRRNPELTIPVRVRDGDQCRWCGRSVKFADHKSRRGGTIDSLNAHKESTVETLVVACRGCNSDRKDGKPGFNLRPAPYTPHYEDSTIEFINGHAWSKANGVHIEKAQTELELKPAAARVDGAPGDSGAARETAAAPSTEAAHSTTAAAREAAAPESSTPQPVGPRPAAAPTSSAPQPADPRDDDDEPEWMTKPVAKVVYQRPAAARVDGAPGDSGAARETAAAPSTEAAHSTTAAARGKDNETVKPDPDQNGYPVDFTGSQGDDPGLSGSGRDGSGRDGQGLLGQARKRRRRGKRGGRRK